MEGLVQQAIQQQVLQVAQQLEEQIDSQLHKLDNLQDDDLERIRQRRVQELRLQQEKTKEWVAKGHGEYKEIFEEKEFFKEMKGEERMICHFYRDNWPCKVRMRRHTPFLDLQLHFRGPCAWPHPAATKPACNTLQRSQGKHHTAPPSSYAQSLWLSLAEHSEHALEAGLLLAVPRFIARP
jgi:hypothetical protein